MIPSVLEISFFVAPKNHTTIENTTNTTISIIFSPINCNGLIADAIPSTIRILKIFEPIAFGGDLTVDAASRIAIDFGMSQNLVGLTIVSIGTSLPELVTSIVAARKNEVDMAVV